MNVLVIDVGGSHIKLYPPGADRLKFASGPDFTAEALVTRVRADVARDTYDVVSIGLPASVSDGAVAAEPGNLGEGWVGFDFERALDAPVRLVNDAVMQALGAYDGGRMLFLGLGTGLGSALVTEHVVVPLELGELPYGNGQSLFDRLGRAGLEALGRDTWARDVAAVCAGLRAAFLADYILLGGGNADEIEDLPEHVRRGGNDDARLGGLRLWEERVELHDRQPPRHWRVVR